MKVSEALTDSAKKEMFETFKEIRKIDGLKASFDEFCDFIDNNLDIAIMLLKSIIG